MTRSFIAAAVKRSFLKQSQEYEMFMVAIVLVVFLHVLVGIALLVLRSTAKRKIPKASVNPLKALTQLGQSAPEDKFMHAMFFANSVLLWCYPVLMAVLLFQ